MIEYVDRQPGRFPTYEPFRKCIGGIYGVSRALDPTPPPSMVQITTAVRHACKGRDEDMNLEAAAALYGLLDSLDFQAYDHDPKSLSLGPDRKCYFRIAHYLVKDDEAVFQFPYPRRTRLSDREYAVMMSLIAFAYAKGDFEGAAVEIADLSCEAASVRVDGQRVRGPRTPRIIRLSEANAVDRADLQAEIEDIYRILMEISET